MTELTPNESPPALSKARYDSYHDNGFLAGIPVYDNGAVAHLRAEIESLEATHSAGVGDKSLGQMFRVNGHVVIPFLAQAARSPAILDVVEQILGPNLLVWSVELFIKEANSDRTVSWHQDLTYWGMGETNDEVTAWIALSDVSKQAGCMRFIPGSHRNDIVAHHDTFDDTNLLSRGQEIPGVDEALAHYGVLRPGEMSLHHGRCFHASGPNQSDDRRIGLAIRYVTPEVHQDQIARDYAMLVRGTDAAPGWINIAGPQGLFHPSDLALYDRILKDQAVSLTAGAAQTTTLYST